MYEVEIERKKTVTYYVNANEGAKKEYIVTGSSPYIYIRTNPPISYASYSDWFRVEEWGYNANHVYKYLRLLVHDVFES